MAFYAPKLYCYMSDHLEPLFANESLKLKRNFPGSIFPAATFNLGPRVTTYEHVDCCNLAFGWCSIWAGGSFNPKAGGHFVFYDLKLAVEFPEGSTVLMPSSTLRHGNTKISDEEERVSMTQYCPGGLVRWVRHGFRPTSSLTDAEREGIDGAVEQQRAEALGRWSKVGELAQDREALVKKGGKKNL